MCMRASLEKFCIFTLKNAISFNMLLVLQKLSRYKWLVGSHVYRQISKCTDKTPKKHYGVGGGGGGGVAPLPHPPPPPPSPAIVAIIILAVVQVLRAWLLLILLGENNNCTHTTFRYAPDALLHGPIQYFCRSLNFISFVMITFYLHMRK